MTNKALIIVAKQSAGQKILKKRNGFSDMMEVFTKNVFIKFSSFWSTGFCPFFV